MAGKESLADEKLTLSTEKQIEALDRKISKLPKAISNAQVSTATRHRKISGRQRRGITNQRMKP